MEVAGIVEIFDECGVVGLEPANDWTADAFSDCIVPIYQVLEKKKKKGLLMNMSRGD